MISHEAVDRNNWLDDIKSLSARTSLLPTQVDLLARVYDSLQVTQRKVAVFVAPPAAGKTHAICLLAAYLSRSSAVAIVVPSNYLKREFRREFRNLLTKPRGIDVLSIFEFLRKKEEYDFVLVDESHNLKSFIELDDSVVRTVTITAEDDVSQDLEAVYLRAGRRFSAQQISYGSAADILDSLRATKHAAVLQPIFKSPTSWMYFVYAWQDPLIIQLKAVNASNLHGFKIPKKQLLLFSATPLSNEELQFYCGIDLELVQRAAPVDIVAPSQLSSLYLSSEEQLNASKKLRTIAKLLNNTHVRTLILLNNANQVKALANSLDRKRLFTGTGPHLQRMKDFRKFMSQKTAVLLTSSSIFWEGITIEGVRLLIIPEPPFPRPPLLDLRRKVIINGRVDVERRLQQAVGRIARRPEEYGVCVVLFSLKKLLPHKSKYFAKKTLFRELPTRRIVQETVDYLRARSFTLH